MERGTTESMLYRRNGDTYLGIVAQDGGGTDQQESIFPMLQTLLQVAPIICPRSTRSYSHAMVISWKGYSVRSTSSGLNKFELTRYGESYLARMKGDRQIKDIPSRQFMGQLLPYVGKGMVCTGSQTMGWNQDHPVKEVSDVEKTNAMLGGLFLAQMHLPLLDPEWARRARD